MPPEPPCGRHRDLAPGAHTPVTAATGRPAACRQAGVTAGVQQFAWVRAVDRLREGPRRRATLSVGSQLVVAGVLVVCALPGLTRAATLRDLSALADLLLAAGLGVSARSTALAARRTGWGDSYPVAQLSAVVVLTLGGAVAPDPGATGLCYVLLVLCSAPWLPPLPAAVVVAACAAGHLVVAVAHGGGGQLLAGEATLTGLLVAAVLAGREPAADRAALTDLVAAEITDRVTGLPTVRYLDEAGRYATARTCREAPVAVVAVRLEGLKAMVRDHGQDVADVALERCAERLRAALRPGDVLARTAADELVALLPSADAVAAAEVAGALRAAAADGDVPAPGIVTGVAAAAPRHPAGRVADLVARARAQQPARAGEESGDLSAAEASWSASSPRPA